MKQEHEMTPGVLVPDDMAVGDYKARCAVLEAEVAELRKRVCVSDVSTMARVLSDRVADARNIDLTDNWAMYGEEYIEDVRAMLAAAPATAERVEQEAVLEAELAKTQQREADTDRQLRALRKSIAGTSTSVGDESHQDALGEWETILERINERYEFRTAPAPVEQAPNPQCTQAISDAITTGHGFMSAGKRVPPEDVYDLPVEQVEQETVSYYERAHGKKSPTHGMSLDERIEHVEGRTNAAGYIEFDNVMAVSDLIDHVLRDSPAPRPAAPAPVERVEQEAKVFWVLFDNTGGEKYIKKDADAGTLAFFDNEEDAARAKRFNPGTDYKRVEYYTTPQPAPTAAPANCSEDAINSAIQVASELGGLEDGSYHLEDDQLTEVLACAVYHSAPTTAQDVEDPWKPSDAEYDRAIHHNPDAKAWADLFVQTFPAQADQHALMLGWFANAMMAMHDHLTQKENTTAQDVAGLVDVLERALEYWRDRQQRYKNRKPRWVVDAESALAAHHSGGAK